VKDGSPPGKSCFQRLIELGVIAAITLGILEAILRMMGLTQPILYANDDHAGYRMKPDQQVTYLGNTIAINRWGARDARDFEANSQGVQRTVVLGDSVTWGGIREKQEHLFTSVLEAALPGSEVINCGVNGYSVTQMVELYEYHLSALKPDRVVLFAIPRDFTRPPISKLTGEGVAFPQHPPRSAVHAAFALVRHLAAERFDWEWLRSPSAAAPEDATATAEDSFARNLDSLTKLLETAGRERLLVVLLPTLPGSPDADKMDRFVAELRNRDVPFENLADRATLRPEDFVDGVHLTTDGHRIVGTALAEILGTREVADPTAFQNANG
jgi:lysophospholipase L1-like esterase